VTPTPASAVSADNSAAHIGLIIGLIVSALIVGCLCIAAAYNFYAKRRAVGQMQRLYSANEERRAVEENKDGGHKNNNVVPVTHGLPSA